MNTSARARGISHSGLLLFLLLWAAGWSAAGWTLSALGQLNFAGCTAAAVPILALSIAAWRTGSGWGAAGGWWRLRRLRHNRWAQAYLFLLLLSVVGGVWREPGNIDALTYRLPRIFHWVVASRWHWIETENWRMNVTTPGFEWLSLPAWVWAHDVRSIAWANLLAFMLLPGLVFSVLRSLGVHGRVARLWMYLLPTGYGYLLQAGSAGNDLMGTIYFLAALDLAVRARRAGAPALYGSLLGMALCTGVKLSNCPLGLAWAVTVRPAAQRYGKAAPLLAALLLGAGVSALPTMVLNRWQTGTISGDPQNLLGAKPLSMPMGLAGNALLLTTQNLLPPVFPVAAAWNAWTTRLQQGPLAALVHGFPRFNLHAGELAQEEWAGLGVGLLLVAAWGRYGPGGRRRAWRWNSAGGGMVAAAGAGVLFYSVTVASEMPARLLLPCYPLLLGGWLLGTDPRGPMARKAGRWLAGGSVALAAVPLIFGPSRPLWPWQPVLAWLGQRSPGSAALQRLAVVYHVYAQRPDPLAELRPAWPPEEQRIGFLGTADDSEVSLWQPGGSRVVVTATSLAGLRPEKAQVRYVVAQANAIPVSVQQEFAAARAAGELELVRERTILVKASAPSEPWQVWRWRNPR